MSRLAPIALRLSATAAILTCLPGAAFAQQLTGSSWSCSGSSDMRNDAGYRLNHRQGFDAQFRIVVGPPSSGKVQVGIVSEQWTFGAKTVVEYRPSANLERDAKGRDVIRMTYLGITRSAGDTRRYPAFAEGLLNYDDNGNLILRLLVSGSGDVVIGKCYPG